MPLNTTLTDDLIYDECLKLHAYKWMSDYVTYNSITYVELLGGPLLAHYISKYGSVKVLNDLDKKLNDLIQ